jgi:hydroxyacylglutathione hydrolase
MNLVNIPILEDNYVWLLTNDHHTIIIDPGVAQPIIDYVQKNGLSPTAILLTHHHQDHVGGVRDLLAHYPQLMVYGPQETLSKGAQWIIDGDDMIEFGNLQFSVISVPGHTRQHVAYYSAPYLFCGDTLFSGGCGRIFEGTHPQMYESLMKLAKLPDETLICCAHEYTLSNLNFAHSIVPDDQDIETARQKVIQLRQNGQPTLPSVLADEKRINIFLRCENPSLKQRLLGNSDQNEALDLFIYLRNKKDHY